MGHQLLEHPSTSIVETGNVQHEGQEKMCCQVCTLTCLLLWPGRQVLPGKASSLKAVSQATHRGGLLAPADTGAGLWREPAGRGGHLEGLEPGQHPCAGSAACARPYQQNLHFMPCLVRQYASACALSLPAGHALPQTLACRRGAVGQLSLLDEPSPALRWTGMRRTRDRLLHAVALHA